jgi:hypothetical protein
MRCVDLPDTWTKLAGWFDQHGILVLPQLCADGPVVRLDADVDQGRTARPADLERVVSRLCAVVERFGARAVYVHRVGGEPAAEDEERELSIVTVRVMAGGVVHELMLFAGWYADLLDRTVGMEFAHKQ